MELELLQRLDKPHYLVVEFENPADHANPIIVRKVLRPNVRITKIISKEFMTFMACKEYTTKISLYDSKALKTPVSKLTDQLIFSHMAFK